MTISLRSIKLLMKNTAPGRKISEEAVRTVKTVVERKAEELTIQASRIHDRENDLRRAIGARPKVVLTKKHIEMAIDGRFAGGDRNAES